MGNGSVSELCYRIDGFDVHIDPFGNMGCFNIQDKVIIGLLGAAFIFSIPFLNLILSFLYPIFWCLGFILPQMNSRQEVIEQSKKLRQEEKDLRIATRNNNEINETVAEPSEEPSEEPIDVELDSRSKRIIQTMYGLELNSDNQYESNVRATQRVERHEKRTSLWQTISDAIFMGT